VLRLARWLWRDGWHAEPPATTRGELARVVDELDARPLGGRAFMARNLYAKLPKRLVEQIHDEELAGGEALTEFLPEEVLVPGEEVEPRGETAKMTMVEALRAALAHGMQERPEMVVLGEDVGLEGGIFRVTDGLLERYGEPRVIDTPLSETGIVGTAVGMAMAGLRPVAEIMFGGFLYPAMDQLITHLARMRWRTRGGLPMPVVVRVAVGGGHLGAESHSDSPETLLVHVPGLLVVCPSTPYEAKGLLAAALESDDPVLFLEPTGLYHQRQDAVPVAHYRIPIGRGRVARPGSDVTVVTYGNGVAASLEAAAALEREVTSCEVIDLRTLYPWDEDLVLSSVERTGRLVTVHEAPVTLGMGAEIVATVAEKGAYALTAPVARVGHADLHWGPLLLERYSVIPPERVAAAVRRVVEA
jgi:pyruvate dehydrogenase E1 component beta subunit